MEQRGHARQLWVIGLLLSGQGCLLMFGEGIQDGVFTMDQAWTHISRGQLLHPGRQSLLIKIQRATS